MSGACVNPGIRIVNALGVASRLGVVLAVIVIMFILIVVISLDIGRVGFSQFYEMAQTNFNRADIRHRAAKSSMTTPPCHRSSRGGVPLGVDA